MSRIVCSVETCNAPKTGCFHTGESPEACEHFQGESTSSHDSSDLSIDTEKLRPAWSGNSFTPLAAQFIAGQQRPILLGLVGFADAGKTSLLASLYLLLTKGREIPQWAFAGSFTLYGWDLISRSLAWKGDEKPTYPPRTTGEGREPGLLHLRFATREANWQDVLITDVPGEWFRAWNIEPNQPSAEGAAWILRHADSLCFVVDGRRLSDPLERNTAARETLTLLNRFTELKLRPTQIIWTKADETTSNPKLQAVKTALEEGLPDAKSFHTIATNGHEAQGTDVLEWFSEVLISQVKPAVTAFNDVSEAANSRAENLSRWFTRGT